MAAILWEDVVAEAPEVSGTDTRAQTVILGIVNGDSGPDPSLFTQGEASPKLKLMRALLAAHVALSNDIGVSSGPVTSERASELARTYATPRAELYQETSYGRLYWTWLRTSAARIGFVPTWGC